MGAVKAIATAAAAVGLALGAAGVAFAAPGGGAKNGHLVLAAGDETVTLPPGQAVKAAVAECADLDLEPAVVTVASVRAAFPAPVEVCTGVTLASKVAADDDEPAGPGV